MPLEPFTPAVRDWFLRAFDAPTRVQEQAWEPISRGEHALISAPTGSGKTLAAFLWGIDRLVADPLPAEERRVRLLYVSPLKALSHDIERNLRAPLRGVRSAVPDAPEIEVALRTGDTPQKERQAMRRRPPDVLITTPESLFLMLTSGAREILRGVESVIVDEIHAVAATKRGSHLALTLERLSALRAAGDPDRPGAWSGDDVQRIGLSATQNPLEEVGRFLVGPRRTCRVIDTQERKPLDLEIRVPVESMVEPEQFSASRPPSTDPLEPVVGGEATRSSIWPAMYPELLDLVEEHRSTLVFVNNRRGAERLALRLNELAVQRAEERAGGGQDPTRDGEGGAAAAGGAAGDTDGDGGGGGPDVRAADRADGRADGGAAHDGPARDPTTGRVEGGELRRVRFDHDATVGGPERHAQIPVPVTEAQHGNPGGGPHAVEVARAHHGSLSREERLVVEELLKSGRLPCLVATSSLELGIDMGAVDLVLQIESPKAVARGLQRIGRAGHTVGETAKGRIFPKFRADLLECAVVAQRMREGAIEPTVVPRNALDVLAQQIVAIAASAEDPAGPSPVATNARRGPRSARRVGVADGELDDDAGLAEGASAAEAADAGTGTGPEDGATEDGASARPDPDEDADAATIGVDELHALITGTHSYADLPRELLENVLDMLDGRYPSQDFAELRARIVWDRIGGTVRARKGAGRLAITNAGTIPDRGLYRVVLPDGRRVGELDEEMVYEARAGQTFLLGASTWRIEEIGRDKVVVTPAPGAPGAVPFWRGDQVGRPVELGRAIGAFTRWAVDQDEDAVRAACDLDPLAARNLLEYLRDQQEATRVVPSDRTLVVERFKDEIGDWRLCLLSPFGGRVHAAWGLALARRIREERGLECDAIWSDDGIVVHLPDADGAGGVDDITELLLLDPETVEEQVIAELAGSALFGSRFRENAARSLLIPRAYPGRRTPLWQQRLKAQSLLEVASRYPDFPVILETYRECLRDVLDLPALTALLRQVERREVQVVEAETQTASPFASSLLFDYVATYMYEGDSPNAERRAAALSLDRDLLRELLGQEELRDLLDPAALHELEADLQHRSPRTRARSPDGLVEVLRRVGDLTVAEVADRVDDGPRPGDADRDRDGGGRGAGGRGGGPGDAAAADPHVPDRALAERWLARLLDDRRAVRVRIGGEDRWIAADDAGLFRDALGVVPPGGLPEPFTKDVDDALGRLVERYAATHGPFEDGALRARYRIDASAALRERERSGALLRGELRPGGTEREWCDPDVLRRLRRMSLAVLRKEIEASEPRALVPFALSWQGVDRHPAAGAGLDRLREVLVPLQGLALPVELWERDVLPRRCGAYSPSWLDQLCASGEVVWVGAGALGRGSGRVALYFREDAAELGAPGGRPAPLPPAEDGAPPRTGPPGAGEPEVPDAPDHRALRARLARAPAFFTELLVDLPGVPPSRLQEVLWDLVWAGEVTSDVFAPLRAPGRTLASGAANGAARPQRPTAQRRRFGPRRGGAAQTPTQGRWALAAPLFQPVPDPGRRRRTLAELLLERHGILTREHVRTEGVRGGFSILYESLQALETLGVCRRGYFVEGLGGAQFALPGAVERLRSVRLDDVEEERTARVVGAADPAQPYGGVLPWPEVQEATGRRPQRATGAQVVLVGPDPVLFLERSGKAVQTLVGPEDPRLPAAFAALVRWGAEGPRRRAGVQLEKVDGEPVVGSPVEALLEPAGFRRQPTKFLARA